MGIDWWPHLDDKGLTAAAEKTQEILSRANRASCLAYFQLNALKAWMTVLALSMFEKKKLSSFMLESYHTYPKQCMCLLCF